MKNNTLEAIADRLATGLTKAKALGARAAKIEFSRSESLEPSYESGRLKDIRNHQSASYEIETLVGDRRGSTSGNNIDDLDELVARAVTLAAVGAQAHFDSYPSPAACANVKLYSKTVEALSLDAMLTACSKIVDALKARDKELHIDAGASRESSESILLTTGGVRHLSKSTHWDLSAGIQKTDGTDMLFAWKGRSWREVNSLFDPDYIISEIIKDIDRGEKIVESPSGNLPVLLTPGMTSSLLKAFALAVNGKNVAKGDSPFKEKLGQTVASSNVTIYDDPHCDYSPGAETIDSDGVPTRRQTVIENGVLKRFLYDLDTAGLAGVEPTGNDGSSFWSSVIPAGEVSSDALQSGIKDGLLIKSLIGFGQSNLINGDFSCNVALGFRVQNGEITGRVKNVMIAGNVFDLFRTSPVFSSDIDPVRRLPWMLLNEMSVSR